MEKNRVVNHSLGLFDAPKTEAVVLWNIFAPQPTVQVDYYNYFQMRLTGLYSRVTHTEERPATAATSFYTG